MVNSASQKAAEDQHLHRLKQRSLNEKWYLCTSNCDSNAGFGSDGSDSDWVKSLDSHWEETINCQDPLVVLLSAKDKIKAVSVVVLDPLTRKIRDEKYEWKYGCDAKGCTKLFHALEFVHKHLKRKHPEVVIELIAKMHEEIYDQNYMTDPNAPGGTPVMQQPAPPDRMRWRPPLANRLRDECGGPHMDEDRGNKWRVEGSPTCDGDKSEAKNGNDPIFDSFGGPHMKVVHLSCMNSFLRLRLLGGAPFQVLGTEQITSD